MALAVELEGRAGRIELQRGPVLALGFKQAIIAQAQAGALGLLLPPLRPQRQRVLPPLGQPRSAHRAIQRAQRLFGQRAWIGLLQLFALGRGQQTVAIRRVERARFIEPAFDRTAGHQQPAVGIAGHGLGEGGLRALGGGAIGTAQQHHHLARAAIGDAPGDITQQAIVRILRQQGEDVGVDPRFLAPQAPLLRAHHQQHQQPGNAQPMPPPAQALRPLPRGVSRHISQSGVPRRRTGWPALRSTR